MLAAGIFALSMLVTMDAADAVEKGSAAPANPEQRCVTVETVRGQLAVAHATERLFLDEEHATALLAQLHAPPTARAILFVSLPDHEREVVAIVFGEHGCQIGYAILPVQVLDSLREPQT
jgi:hypothetical protein